MNRNSAISIIVILFLLVSGCSGSSPSADTAQQETNTPDSVQFDPAVALSAVEFQGELPFERELTVDISQMLQEADYGNPSLEGVSRDGANILVRVTSNTVDTVNDFSIRRHGYIRIDSETGDAKWVFTEVHPNTLIRFDENNIAVIAESRACLEIEFNDVAGDSPINFNNLIPNDRCLGQTRLSGDGNVLVFESFNKEPIVNGYLRLETKYFAYNFNSALLNQYPDTSIVAEGNLLEPAIPLYADYYSYPTLSNDGTHVISKQWWGLIDDNIESPNLIGSVIWNTQTNQWKTGGLATGDRSWCGNNIHSCAQPFRYLLSADGNVQYSQIPTGEHVDSNRFDFIWGSTIARSLSSDSNEVTIAGLENALGFSVNRDGRFLSFYATEASGDLIPGLTIYDSNSGEYISVETALPTCDPENSEFNESNCEGISDDGMWHTYFLDEGFHLMLSAREFPSNPTTEYILDLGGAALYLIPSRLSAFPGMVSGDGTVFAAPSRVSDNGFYIARR